MNEQGRDWFVGDMHGEIDLLKYFLDKVKIDHSKDRLIAVGDLVDRGPRSRELLEFFGDNPSWFHSVLGNHDAMMRETLVYSSYDSRRAWGYNGNKWTDGLSQAEQRQLGHLSLRMPLAIEVPLSDGRRVGVVHAEMPVLRNWNDTEAFTVAGEEAAEMGTFDGTQLLWGRSRVVHALAVRKYPKAGTFSMGLRARALELLQPVRGIDLVVMGHTRLEPKTPLQCANMLWIDTGGGYEGGRLTFVDLVAGEYVQLSHGRKRFRRSKLQPPCSLSGWQLTAEQQVQARAEEIEREKKNRQMLAIFGFGLPNQESSIDPDDRKKGPT